MSLIAVIGAGLGGCECALHLARAGFEVALFEQKPNNFSPAHHSKNLAELVCSNSLRSDELTSGVGLLKQELRDLGSAVMDPPGQTRVPAGKALAVDRTLFARRMTELVEAQPGIRLVRREITSLGDPELERAARIVIAAGPLLAGGLCAEITGLTDRPLYFYDAVAPVISGDSVDKNTAFTGSRGETGDDYLNCPMTKEEYLTFYTALREARRTPARDFEKETHFEGCMPIEALADRGERTLAFGPLKPVGFVDPRSGKRPWALVQLRAENLNRTAFNLVGCGQNSCKASRRASSGSFPVWNKRNFCATAACTATAMWTPRRFSPKNLRSRCARIYISPGSSAGWKVMWNPPLAASGSACFSRRGSADTRCSPPAGKRPRRATHAPPKAHQALPALQYPLRADAGTRRTHQTQGTQSVLCRTRPCGFQYLENGPRRLKKYIPMLKN